MALGHRSDHFDVRGRAGAVNYDHSLGALCPQTGSGGIPRLSLSEVAGRCALFRARKAGTAARKVPACRCLEGTGEQSEGFAAGQLQAGAVPPCPKPGTSS